MPAGMAPLMGPLPKLWGYRVCGWIHSWGVEGRLRSWPGYFRQAGFSVGWHPAGGVQFLFFINFLLVLRS